MQFCVIGLGRFGSSIAYSLAEKGHEVLAVDKEETRVADIEEHVSRALVLDATNERALRSLGVENFDWVIIATSQDIEVSILSAMLMKELGVKRIIAKAGSEIHAKILKRIGVDKVVFPEREMGERIAESLASPKIFDYIELSEDYSIVELLSPKDFIGKTIKDTEARTKYGVYIIAIQRKIPQLDEEGNVSYKEEVLIAPRPEEEVLKGDILILLGHVKGLEEIQKL